MNRLDRIEDAIEDIRKGKMVILVDDEDRENEGDVVIAADKVTPRSLNFMILSIAFKAISALGVHTAT